MKLFGKHLLHGMLWLLASEILCLILAVSLAILRDHAIMRIIGLVFGITAHVLLIGSCAQKAAGDDAVIYRTEGKKSKALKPVLISVLLTVPAEITYFLLCLHPESILLLNLFPLLNAPFLQIHRFLIDGTEPFAAIAAVRRHLMAFPPVITAVSYAAGYAMRYLPAAAGFDARSNRT